MTRIADAHQSGHAPARDAQVHHAFLELSKHCSVGVWTEARNLKVARGWDKTKGETSIFWQKRTWQLLETDISNIPTPRWKRGTAHRTTFELHWALLQNLNDGKLLLRAGGHHPSRLYTRSHARANDAILLALPGMLHDLMKKHEPDDFAYSADWNMDLRRETKVQRAERVTHQIKMGCMLHVPPAATIGRRRRIDAVITDGPAKLKMADRQRGLDHRGFLIHH